MEVFGCVLVFGAVAASHVAATQAKTKVHPTVPHLEALFATPRMRLNLSDLI
jgi:hypothetical protein